MLDEFVQDPVAALGILFGPGGGSFQSSRGGFAPREKLTASQNSVFTNSFGVIINTDQATVLRAKFRSDFVKVAYAAESSARVESGTKVCSPMLKTYSSPPYQNGCPSRPT